MKSNHNGQQPHRTKHQVTKISKDPPEKPSNPQLTKSLDNYENKVEPEKPLTGYQCRIPAYENKHNVNPIAKNVAPQNKFMNRPKNSKTQISLKKASPHGPHQFCVP